jgi:hypothetical protein
LPVIPLQVHNLEHTVSRVVRLEFFFREHLTFPLEAFAEFQVQVEAEGLDHPANHSSSKAVFFYLN